VDIPVWPGVKKSVSVTTPQYRPSPRIVEARVDSTLPPSLIARPDSRVALPVPSTVSSNARV
jgi:hypothetical protein